MPQLLSSASGLTKTSVSALFLQWANQGNCCACGRLKRLRPPLLSLGMVSWALERMFSRADSYKCVCASGKEFEAEAMGGFTSY